MRSFTLCYTCGSLLGCVVRHKLVYIDAKNPEIHLAQSTDLEGEILDDANVCMAYYKSQLLIIKRHQ